MSISRNTTSVWVAGAALFVAASIGGLLGGLGSSAPQTAEHFREPPPVTSTSAVVTPPNSLAATSPTESPSSQPQSRASTTPLPASSSAPTAGLSSAPSLVAPASEAAVVEYTVQRGDILYRLARRFNTTPDAIVALNPDINPDSLRVGAVLRIPNAVPPSPAP